MNNSSHHTIKSLRGMLAVAVASLFVAGCHCSIKEDLSDCPQGTIFSFDILYPQTINYSATVKEVRVFAFDEDGKMITEIADKPSAFVPDYRIRTDFYRPGHKTNFYAWSGSNLAQYDFEGFKPGTPLSEMMVSLAKQGSTLEANASPLYAGKAKEILDQQERIGTVFDTVHIDFRQITNRVKIIVEGLNPDHQYTIRFRAQNSRYTGEGNLLPDSQFEYTTKIEDATGKYGKAIRGLFDILLLDQSLDYPVEIIDTDLHKVVYSFDLLKDYICYDGPFAETANPFRLERNHDFDIWIRLMEDKPKDTYFAVQARILDWNLVFRNLDF